MNLECLLASPVFRKYLESLIATDIQYEIIFLHTDKRHVLDIAILGAQEEGAQYANN